MPCYEMRAVQIDLARQIETVETVKAFFDVVASAGMNTVVIPAAYGRDTKPGAAMTMVSHLCAVISIPLMYALLTALMEG